MQAELHKDPHVKPDQVSISRSGACLSLHTRPSTHDAPYHVHGPGSASPVPTPSIPTGKFNGYERMKDTNAAMTLLENDLKKFRL